MKKRILFYCQHVLGMGHFIRSTAIVRGLTDYDVCFLNGGEVVKGFEVPPGIEVVNLPPITADVEFHAIQAAHGEDLEAVKTRRAAQLIAEYERVKPDLVIIELFPFGRRKFSFELIPLLDHIRASGNETRVACSLRDILVSKQNQERYEERVCRLMNQYFDVLLIHSDPRFQRLEETFSRVAHITCEQYYTGFVTQHQPMRSSAPLPERHPSDDIQIVASIGGGRVGNELLACVVEASDLLPMPHKIQMFAGPYMAQDEYERLEAQVAQRPQVTLERYTTRIHDYLARADLSISMAGYNTCMDLVTTGVRALVYPFTGNGDEEQTIRAAKLCQLGVVGILQPDVLAPAYLADQIARQITRTQSDALLHLDTQGVEHTAARIADVLEVVGAR